MDSISGSIARLYSRQDMGSPCHMPLQTSKSSLTNLLILITVVAVQYRFLTFAMKVARKPKASRVLHRYSRSILS